MPVTPVGIVKTANSPYCVRNYKEVNPDFGTLDDLKTLVAASHQRGMAVNRGVPLIYNGQEIALSYPLLFPFTEQKIQWTPNKPVSDEYTRLIKLYNQSTAIRRGMPTSYSTNDVSAFVKESAGDKALVLVNIRNRKLTFNLPGELANTTWYSGFDHSQVKLTTSLDLAPYQYLALTAAPLL